MEHLLELPDHEHEALVRGLETGLLPLPPSEMALRSLTNLGSRAPAVVRSLTEMAELGLSRRACAAWLRSLATARARSRKPDLVWSGPQVPGVPARDTRQVLEELLRTARRSVWLSSYVYFNGPQAFAPLADRMEAFPGLQVRLLLTVPRPKGEASTSADALVERFASRFWTVDWPGDARPMVFYDPRSISPDGPTGVLHAKTVVVDEEVLFVTSANLTEAALDRNIEAGILMRDKSLALATIRHLNGLIERGLLRALPS